MNKTLTAAKTLAKKATKAKTVAATGKKFAESVVIVGYARSPFTPAGKGALAGTRPDDLAAQVVKGLLEQPAIAHAKITHEIEDLLLGCAFPEGEQGFNLARIVAFLAGLPLSVAGATINRFCGSSMQAVHSAAGAIQLGAGEAFLCVGVESMSRVPLGGFNPLPNAALYAKYPQAYIGMGETAENVASRHHISRTAQEEMAVASQQKAVAAQNAGHLHAEIIPISTPKGVVRMDGCLRGETTAEALATLKPAFETDGSVTAGTSSPLTDGAVALLVTSEAFARKHKLPILARVISVAVSGCAPEIMGMGPVEASRKALARAGLKVSDLDVVELNEAFAAQGLAVIKALGLKEKTLNLDGGAIALGHPLGATGARIVGKAAALLQRTGGKYALATQCIGGGQGIATILERVEAE